MQLSAHKTVVVISCGCLEEEEYLVAAGSVGAYAILFCGYFSSSTRPKRAFCRPHHTQVSIQNKFRQYLNRLSATNWKWQLTK